MKRFGLFVVAVLTLCLVALPSHAQQAQLTPAAEQANNVHYMGANGEIVRGGRCATHDLTDAQRAQVEADMAAFGDSIFTRAGGTIPVAFHVVTKTRRGQTTGHVTQQQIDDQIAVLNAAFAGTGFSFTLQTVTYTDNRRWYDGCFNSNTEYQMKSSLAVNVPTTLNIYTCDPSGYLGYAYLPSTLPESDVRHGVVLLHSSLPGGSAAPYNLGDTATHEVGHYLGLEHTFANGCGSPGDYVSDTAPEASAAFGCPVGRDTCAGDGPDPIYNFMDYTDDACMNTFSAGQTTRMQTQVSLYKPSL